MEEVWKDIKGFEGLYQVSNLGRVRSLERYKNNHSVSQYCPQCILIPWLNDKGYNIVKLSKNNKKTHKRIHRLVASAFVQNPENKNYVNHIDGNKTNNSTKNLEWCTLSENTKHAYKIGLMKTKKVLDKKSGIIYNSVREAALSNGKIESSVGRSCREAKKSRWSFV